MSIKEMFLTSIFILLVLVESALATVPTKSLQEMISDSNTIIIGRVIDVDLRATSKTNVTRCDDLVYIATIQVEQRVKGDTDRGDRLKVKFRFILSIEPIFQMGDLSIFFLQKENDNYRVVNGYLGKLDIEESAQMIKYNFIADQPERENVHSFLEKIKFIMKDR